jgi:hypothetical protein
MICLAFHPLELFHEPDTRPPSRGAGLLAAGVLSLIQTDQGPVIKGPVRGSRAVRLGLRAFSISLVNSFGGNFVW